MICFNLWKKRIVQKYIIQTILMNGACRSLGPWVVPLCVFYSNKHSVVPVCWQMEEDPECQPQHCGVFGGTEWNVQRAAFGVIWDDWNLDMKQALDESQAQPLVMPWATSDLGLETDMNENDRLTPGSNSSLAWKQQNCRPGVCTEAGSNPRWRCDGVLRWTLLQRTSPLLSKTGLLWRNKAFLDCFINFLEQ